MFYLGELARGGVERVPTMDEASATSDRQSALWGLVIMMADLSDRELWARDHRGEYSPADADRD